MSHTITDIYLMRHADTFANKKGVYPTNTTNITPVGIIQTFRKVRDLKKLNNDLILNSSLRRAKQTAWIINTILQISRNELLILNERSMFIENGEDIEWESLSGFEERLLQAYDMWVKRPEKSLLIVTHATFIKAIFAMITYGNTWQKSFDLFNTQWAIAPLDYLHIRITENDMYVIGNPPFTRK